MNEFQLTMLIYIAVGVLGGGTLSALLATWLRRRAISAEGRGAEIRGELQIVDAAVQMAEQLRVDLQRVTERVAVLETRNKQLDAKVKNLQLHNESLALNVQHLEAENQELRDRCTALETENLGLRKREPHE